jgi:hypothetical protein
MHAQGSPFCTLHRLFTALNSYTIGTVVKLKFSWKTLRCIEYSGRKLITVNSYLVSEFPFVDINISGKNIMVISTTKIFNCCESSQIELHPPLVGSFRFLPIFLLFIKSIFDNIHLDLIYRLFSIQVPQSVHSLILIYKRTSEIFYVFCCIIPFICSILPMTFCP